MTNLDSMLKSSDITLPTKVRTVKATVFSGVMYGCESWTIKKAECWRIDAFELWCWGRLERPLDCKEIQPVNPKGNQAWIFIGRTDVEAEAPILWPSDAKSQLIGKVPGAEKDWRQEEKGMTEDEMVGWHHWFSKHEFDQALGDGEGQGNLGSCSPWGHKELNTTGRLNNNGSHEKWRIKRHLFKCSKVLLLLEAHGEIWESGIQVHKLVYSSSRFSSARALTPLATDWLQFSLDTRKLRTILVTYP